MTLEERIQRLETRDKTALRRIARLETALKKPAATEKKYETKLKGKMTRADIERRIDQKFLKRNKAA